MHQLFEKHKLPKLRHGKIDNLNRPISIKEIEKAPGPDGFNGRSIVISMLIVCNLDRM